MKIISIRKKNKIHQCQHCKWKGIVRRNRIRRIFSLGEIKNLVTGEMISKSSSEAKLWTCPRCKKENYEKINEN
jgi:ribosomal protein L37AE/L43A